MLQGHRDEHLEEPEQEETQEIESHVQSDYKSDDEIEYLKNKLERIETGWNESWNAIEQLKQVVQSNE